MNIVTRSFQLPASQCPFHISSVFVGTRRRNHSYVRLKFRKESGREIPLVEIQSLCISFSYTRLVIAVHRSSVSIIEHVLVHSILRIPIPHRIAAHLQNVENGCLYIGQAHRVLRVLLLKNALWTHEH